MGGFMPTPAAPAQPPSIKLDTTASSRGTFNNFLKNMNGAMNPPLAPMVGANPMMAPAANIDIFNQPVQMMFDGGFVDDTVGDTSGTFSVDDQGNVSDDFSIGGGGFGGTGSDEQNFQDALDQAIEQASQFGGGQDAVNVFADDPAVVDKRGVNVGLESRGGFSAGVVPGLKGERFARFENVPFAMRGIARDFRSKINNAGDDGITVSKYFNTFNPSDDNKDRLAEFESLTGKKPGDKLNIGDMQNIMNIQAKYEAGIRDVAPSVQKAILSTVNIDDDRKVEDILGSLDLGPLDKKSPTDGIDVFENIIPDAAVALRNFQTGLPGANLPNVGSTRSTVAQDQARAIANLVGGTPPLTDVEKGLQQNQQALMAQRGRALGSTTFDDDLANFTQNQLATGFDEISRVGDDQLAINRLEAENLARLRAQDENVRDMDAIDRLTAGRPSDEFAPTIKSTAPEDFEENVGLPFSDRRMTDIERLLNVPAGQRRIGEGDDPNILAGIPSALNIFETIPREQMAIDVALGRPRSLGEMFRGVTAPSMFVDNQGRALVTDARGNIVPSSTVQPESFKQFTDRLQRNIADESGETRDFTAKSIPESQLIRNNRGRITAITDASGRTITGFNPDEQFFGSDDNELPIIKRPIAPVVEDKKDDDKPPNIIGGVAPRPVTEPLPTVVASPFAPSSAKISPVTFDTGELNKLIELLTGVSAKPVVAKQEGGLVSAVDEFLASGS